MNLLMGSTVCRNLRFLRKQNAEAVTAPLIHIYTTWISVQSLSDRITRMSGANMVESLFFFPHLGSVIIVQVKYIVWSFQCKM